MTVVFLCGFLCGAGVAGVAGSIIFVGWCQRHPASELELLRDGLSNLQQQYRENTRGGYMSLAAGNMRGIEEVQQKIARLEQAQQVFPY